MHDQARTLRELEEELKDAVDTSVALSLGTKERSQSSSFLEGFSPEPEVVFPFLESGR